MKILNTQVTGQELVIKLILEKQNWDLAIAYLQFILSVFIL